MRQEKIVTLNDRGEELTFKIKEMPATQLQKWLLRAGMILLSSGVLSDLERGQAEDGNIIGAALGAVSRGGISIFKDARIDIDAVQPLIDELLKCCYRMSEGVAVQVTPEIVDAMITDIRTLFALEAEAAKINFNFFGQGKPSDTLGKSGTETARATSRQKISMRSKP